MAPPYRILLAEDHVIFRDLVRKSLNEIPGLEVVGETSDGLELLASVETLKPQMIILDIGIPSLSGLEVAQKIKRDHPEIKILVLTMHKSKDHLARAMEAGVDGYMLKEDAFHELLKAIEAIRNEEFYISKLLSQQMMAKFIQKPKNKSGVAEPLSYREIEVLKYFAEGKSNKQISELLFISEPTIRVHLNNIKNKLYIETKIELIRYAFKKGYTSLT
jgi:DNA-binding NarL/FixJ family response regulator